jgi:uncharacterized membrane protein YfcA
MDIILLLLAVQMVWNCHQPASIERRLVRISGKEKLIAAAYGMLAGILNGLLEVTGGRPVKAAMFAWDARHFRP